MLEPEIVRQIPGLAAMSWGSKRVAATLGISRVAARRHLRGAAPGAQERPPCAPARCRPAQGCRGGARRRSGRQCGGGAAAARRAWDRRGAAHAAAGARAAPSSSERRRGGDDSIRDGARASAPDRLRRATRPRRWSRHARLFFVAVLGYSRRIYVRAFLRERHDDWREGLSGAFVYLGGVTQTVLVDNARALIIGRDSESGVVHVHPAFSAFCADWGVAPRACRPYRARTKGKTESGVGYVKRNAVAGRTFDSFAALETHLATWMIAADTRIHGTTRATCRPLRARGATGASALARAAATGATAAPVSASRHGRVRRRRDGSLQRSAPSRAPDHRGPTRRRRDRNLRRHRGRRATWTRISQSEAWAVAAENAVYVTTRRSGQFRPDRLALAGGWTCGLRRAAREPPLRFAATCRRLNARNAGFPGVAWGGMGLAVRPDR